MKLETQSYHGHFIQSLYKEYLLSLTFLHLTTPLVCSTGPGDRLLVSPWDGGLVQPARAPAEVSVCTHSCYLINITKSLIFQSHEFRMLIKTQWQLLTVGFTTVVVRGGKLTPSRPNAGEIGLLLQQPVCATASHCFTAQTANLPAKNQSDWNLASTLTGTYKPTFSWLVWKAENRILSTIICRFFLVLVELIAFLDKVITSVGLCTHEHDMKCSSLQLFWKRDLFWF